jgi:Fis family transcriptional regulator
MKMDMLEPPLLESEAAGGLPLDRNLVLSEQVRNALRQYFAQLDGNDVSGLHMLVLSEVERPLIHAVLEHCGYNQSKAAHVLGLSRGTLRKKIHQYGLE